MGAQNSKNTSEDPHVCPCLLCCSSNCSNCYVAVSPKHTGSIFVCPKPKIDISDFDESCAFALSKLLNSFSSVTWSLGLLYKTPTTLHLSAYSPTLQNYQSIFSKGYFKDVMLASGFSSSYPSKVLAQYDMCE